MNDRLRLSPLGTVLDPVDRRGYDGPVEIRLYPDRIEVRAVLDVPIDFLGYELADAPALRNGEA